MDQLEQIADGLYVGDMTKQIDIDPNQIRIGKYFIPESLGRAEHEEIAARLVLAAREQGQWVGVAYGRFARDVVGDSKAAYEHSQAKRAEAGKGIFARIYSGIKSKLTKKPETEETAQEEKEKTPFSGLALDIVMRGELGYNNMTAEIYKMAEEGYIALVDQEGGTILMPTEKMVKQIADSQRKE